MAHAVKDSDRVICVMTPNYKKKTDNLEGGVGVEYSIISAEIKKLGGSGRIHGAIIDVDGIDELSGWRKILC